MVKPLSSYGARVCPDYTVSPRGVKPFTAPRKLASACIRGYGSANQARLFAGRRQERPVSANETNGGLTYAGAGVDIEAGDALVQAIKPLAKSTARPGADTGLGGFGGAFDLKAAGFTDPVLVSGTDGVGTKLKLAIATGILTPSASIWWPCASTTFWPRAPSRCSSWTISPPASSIPERGADIVSGIAKGCRQAGCALIGGETAEMPGMYAGDDFDLAGFVVGAAERGALLPVHARCSRAMCWWGWQAPGRTPTATR
jgi:hypothetical protein